MISTVQMIKIAEDMTDKTTDEEVKTLARMVAQIGLDTLRSETALHKSVVLLVEALVDRGDLTEDEQRDVLDYIWGARSYR